MQKGRHTIEVVYLVSSTIGGCMTPAQVRVVTK